MKRNDGELGRLFEEIRKTLKKDFDLEIPKEKLLNCKIQKKIYWYLKELYDYSKNNKIEEEF